MYRNVLLILFVINCFSLSATSACKDTCSYDFVENGALSNINKLLNLGKLMKENEGKDFYLLEIRFYDDIEHKRKTVIKDCSSIGLDKIVLFNDFVDSFKYSNLAIDSSILFKHIGDSSTVTFNVDRCGGGFHSDLKVLIFKLYNKYIIGYSFAGGDVMDGFRKIASKYFILNDPEIRNNFFALLVDPFIDADIRSKSRR